MQTLLLGSNLASPQWSLASWTYNWENPLKSRISTFVRIQKVLSEGFQLWQRFFFLFFFLFSWWEEGGSKYHFKQANIGPPPKPHWNGVSLACRWWPNIKCWLGSFVIFRGSGPALLRNPIFLWFFRGGGVRTPCPPFWIRACHETHRFCI